MKLLRELGPIQLSIFYAKSKFELLLIGLLLIKLLFTGGLICGFQQDNRTTAFVFQKDKSSNNVKDEIEKKFLLGENVRLSQVSSSSDGSQGKGLGRHFRCRSIDNGKYGVQADSRSPRSYVWVASDAINHDTE